MNSHDSVPEADRYPKRKSSRTTARQGLGAAANAANNLATAGIATRTRKRTSAASSTSGSQSFASPEPMAIVPVSHNTNGYSSAHHPPSGANAGYAVGALAVSLVSEAQAPVEGVPVDAARSRDHLNSDDSDLEVPQLESDQMGLTMYDSVDVVNAPPQPPNSYGSAAASGYSYNSGHPLTSTNAQSYSTMTIAAGRLPSQHTPYTKANDDGYYSRTIGRTGAVYTQHEVISYNTEHAATGSNNIGVAYSIAQPTPAPATTAMHTHAPWSAKPLQLTGATQQPVTASRYMLKGLGPARRILPGEEEPSEDEEMPAEPPPATDPLKERRSQRAPPSAAVQVSPEDEDPRRRRPTRRNPAKDVVQSESHVHEQRQPPPAEPRKTSNPQPMDYEVELREDDGGQPPQRVNRGHSTPASSSSDSHTAAASANSERTATEKKRETFVVNGRTFTRLSLIGRGGSSRVYKVMAPNSKIFALKRVTFDRADEATVEGYINEIELLKRLVQNERIITLHDSEVNRDRGYLMMLMECGETDLSGLLKKQDAAPVNFNFIRLYWEQMLAAVHAVHEEKIVHSDLKPANFCLVEGSLKLIDFGIAKAIANDTTNIHREQQIGTLNYMSPEALVDTQTGVGNAKLMKLGRSSDVWSLGCILYQMVYRQAPFGQLSLMAKLRAIPDEMFQIPYPATIKFTHRPSRDGEIEREEEMSVDREAIAVMKACLVRDPKKRPTIPELLSHRFLRPGAADQSGTILTEDVALTMFKLSMKYARRNYVNGISAFPSDPDCLKMAAWLFKRMSEKYGP